MGFKNKNGGYEEFDDINDFEHYDNLNEVNTPKQNRKLEIIGVIIIILLAAILFGKSGFFKDDSQKSSDSQNEVVTSQETEVSNNETQVQNSQIEPLYVQSVEQTSQLYDVTNKDYSASRALDGDFSTVWSEGVTGYGAGEWIKLSFPHVQTVSAIKIVNGLVNNKNGYYKNNRVKSLVLAFSDGSTQTIYLEDNNTGYQTIQINPVDTTYVKCIIDSVYSGSKYNDTCIAEIKLLGY